MVSLKSTKAHSQFQISEGEVLLKEAKKLEETKDDRIRELIESAQHVETQLAGKTNLNIQLQVIITNKVAQIKSLQNLIEKTSIKDEEFNYKYKQQLAHIEL